MRVSEARAEFAGICALLRPCAAEHELQHWMHSPRQEAGGLGSRGTCGSSKAAPAPFPLPVCTNRHFDQEHGPAGVCELPFTPSAPKLIIT